MYCSFPHYKIFFPGRTERQRSGKNQGQADKAKTGGSKQCSAYFYQNKRNEKPGLHCAVLLFVPYPKGSRWGHGQRL